MEPKLGAGFGARLARFRTAVALQEADRVPFVPTLGNISVLEYGADLGVTMRDVMDDATRAIPLIDRMLQDIQPDLFYGPDFFPRKAMELLQPICMNYPGKSAQFGDNAVYQCLDHTYLEEDEYDDFIQDPSRFLLTRVLPVKYQALGGLAMLNPYALCGSTVMGFAALAAPPMQAALRTMLDTGEAVASYIGSATAVAMHLMELGFPSWGSCVCSSPFDDFADNIRGMLNTIVDLTEDPEPVVAAVDRYTDLTIANTIAMAKMSHSDTVFIPLHVGMDEFMSVDSYRRYYWPPLQKMLCAYIDAGLTPMVFCEGNYFTRLEVLREVPKGKVVYFFEKQDMVRAKQVLGDVACIAGNFNVNLLTYGTEVQVRDETKRLLDLLAPGGGYLMSNGISLDVGNRRNLAAWYETVETYGVYR